MIARPVFVLGMHRSGTSCLTGSLEAAGIVLGDVVTAAPFNAKGSRERRAVFRLNDAVLADNGGSWFDPPRHVAWNDARRRERDGLLRAYEGIERWGLKDPRILLTLDGWREAVPMATFVGTFRHPAAVVQSLVIRKEATSTAGPSSREAWLGVWCAYNRRLLDLWERERFPIVDFDRPDDAYLAAVRGCGAHLELPGDPSTFFDPALRRNRAERSPSIEGRHVDQAKALYARLREIAGSPA